MANVLVKFVGGVQKEIEATTIADVKNTMNASKSTATVNGEARTDSHVLTEGDFVVLSEQVKGNMGSNTVASTKDKQLVVVKQGKHKKYLVNGVLVTEKQLEKVCFDILNNMGWDIKR